MSREADLIQQTQILAEALREAAMDLLQTIRKINIAYSHWVEFCEEQNAGLSREPEEESEDVLNTSPMEHTEVATFDLAPENLCENCGAFLPKSETYCILCGVERDE